MSTVWDKAQSKRDHRRNEGAACIAVPDFVNSLNKMLGEAVPDASVNTNNTYVIGYYSPKSLFMAVGIPVDNREALDSRVELLKTTKNAFEDCSLTYLTRSTNLHAEMRVVQYVCETYEVSKSGLRGHLTICCTGKGCCADCCGWMTRYGVDHGPVCNAKGSNQGWMHPLTGAVFRGEGAQFEYSKGSKYNGAATQFKKDPGLKK